MATFIIALIVIVGVLLGLVILVQNPKGGGLATGFSGAHQIGGVQRTTDFLEKSTWYLTIALFVLCLVSAKFFNGGQATTQDALGDDLIEQSITTPGEGADTVEPDNGGGLTMPGTEETPAE